jgi:aminopeptidase I zinc metalloprotease (M18)
MVFFIGGTMCEQNKVTAMYADFFDYIESSTSSYHTVEESYRRLEDQGFTPLSMDEEWNLTEGDYVIDVYGTTLVAFHIGKDPRGTLRIASAHTDFPGFRVKPNPMITDKGYGKLNVESYGGLIQYTWFDRPLSLAGVVVTKGEGLDVETHYVDVAKPVATIPSLAIHMNRTVNEKAVFNKQKEMLPLILMRGVGTEYEEDKTLLNGLLAEEIGCESRDILSYELTLYNTDSVETVGFDAEFISAPRLDNLTSCYACLQGILSAKKQQATGIRMVFLFDHEEVGSRTKQGGASMLLPNVVRRVYRALGLSEEACDADIAKGFMISSDVAHGYHPNYGEKNDITNYPTLNGGVVLKIASSQSYAGDAVAQAIVTDLCDTHGIKHQIYVNRSDMPGGSTVGSISSAQLVMRTMDVGLPLLAMHSARELMGTYDQIELNRLLTVFLGEE